jgi:lysophospholipid acyltransferase (LPLAT)-like uncharacterized protein
VDPEVLRNDPGSLILLWHNRLFVGLGALRFSALGDRPLHGLVSASRDGAQLSVFLRELGIVPIRGSSSRRGAIAAREIVKVLERGHDVGITVDGPRGPCYHAQAGAAMLVQATGAPLYIVGAECESCRTLNSWDRFIVPNPGSRVNITLERHAPPAPVGGKEERMAIQAFIQERLRALTRDIHGEGI